LKKILIALILLFSIAEASAQIVKGKIIDATTSESIENAKILDANSEVLVFSDSEGNFELEIQNKSISLKISALGYLPAKYEGLPNSTLIISLTPSREALSEVIVNGALISKTLQRTPAAISILTSGDLQKTDPSNLAQVFNNVAGVYVNQGALNTTKLNIRGIGARSQFSTNRIQAYFNGIPLTTGEGELTIDDFDAEAISKIEIIKGPTS